MLTFATIILSLFYLEIHGAKLPTDPSDIGLTPDQIIQNHGYVCETHYITTEDGYILAYHRIPHGIIDNEDTDSKPVVLLMHGLEGASADFVMTGPNRALAFFLADAGYDVWLANARGNTFSRNHTRLNPDVDNAEFYNFTFHEIGYYDAANAIDYILNVTGQESLYYIGHSQGTTVFLVLVSTRPEYKDKIKMASLMAPAGILQHYPSTFIQVVCKYVDEIWSLAKKLMLYEVPYVKEIREIGMTRCRDTEHFDTFCNILYAAMLSGDGGQIEKEFLPVIFTNNPANAGIKQYVHYGQLVKNGGFKQFDYGPERNIEIYGTEEPPAYNLSKIAIPIAFYYGNNDGIIAVEDVKTLISMVPEVANDYLVPYELFKHVDFIFARDIIKLVYNELLSVMQKY